MSGPPTIFPPLPINIPGTEAPVTMQPGTGLSYFQPQPPSISIGNTLENIIPGETPPNCDALVGFGVVTEIVAPGLEPEYPELSNVTIEPYPQPPPGPPQPTPPPSFLPTDIAGIELWLRADLGISPTGGPVAAWADQSGTADLNKNVTQAVGSQQPTLNSSDPAYNNQATLSFNSTDSQFMQSGAWASPLPEPETIFIVGNFSGAAVSQYISDSLAENQRVVFNNSGASNGCLYAGSFLDSGTPLSASPTILVGVFNGVTSSIYVSKRSPNMTGNSGTPPSRTGLTVAGAAAFLNGKVAEVIIYNNILSGSDFTKVLNYLSVRYAIILSN
jgi:hypothetical protein